MAKKGKQKSVVPPNPSAQASLSPLTAGAGVRTNDLAAMLTDEERDAPFAAVLTPEQLDAALVDTEPARVPVVAAGPLTLDEAQRAAEAEARQSELRFELTDADRNEIAHDDGRITTPGVVNVAALWWARLETLSAEQGMTPTQYVEGLIRRQWVARPLAGKVK